MTISFKEQGPNGVARPFKPSLEANMPLDARQTEALEHIAVSLSAIDHNIDMIAKFLAQIAAKPR